MVPAYTNSNLHNEIFESLHILMRNHSYIIGDIAYSKYLPSYIRLECIESGTTSANTSPLTSVTAAQAVTFTDGTVKWICDDIRNGDSVGEICFKLNVPAGYLILNG